MATRSVLLVGSMPFADETECMTRALDALGPYVFSLPDGEVGERTERFPGGTRSSWVNYAIERLYQDTSSWRVLRESVRGADGWPVDYVSFQHLEPLYAPDEMAERVDFGYDRFFQQSFPVFQRLKAERGLPELRFQLGIPTGSALGFAFPSPEAAMPYIGCFNTVFAREVNAALQLGGDDVIVQLEVPPELFAAYQFPAMIDVLSLGPIYDLLAKITPGARIGMHLCLGDFHNRSIVHPETLDTMVEFSNRLVDGWPEQHQLAYVHFPFAEGEVPPTTDAAYYAPLQQVRLPGGTRFIAGFVHERRTLDEQRGILAAIEQARGEQVDVACSCGLGRRTPGAAERLFERMSELAQDS